MNPMTRYGLRSLKGTSEKASKLETLVPPGKEDLAWVTNTVSLI
jgi:hypothetical protein